MSQTDVNLQDKIKKDLKKNLDQKRYEHTMGVAYTAASLAMCHDKDAESAYIAGLLHDCAKYMSNDEKLKYCTKNMLYISDTESQNPSLLHGKVGSDISRKKYKIKDEDILNAITFHTTGRPEMSDLEKIIFIADYIEPHRTHDPDLKQIRHVAFQNLDKALELILINTLSHLDTMDRAIDPMTEKTYMYYTKKRR